MPQIAVRLSEEELSALDDLVAAGKGGSRAEVVRRGLALVRKQARSEWIAEDYRRAYANKPLTREEQAWLDEAAVEAFRRVE